MWNEETPGCSTDVTEQRRDEGQIPSTSQSNSVNEIPSTSQSNSVVLPQQNQGVNIHKSKIKKFDHREDNRSYTQTINNQFTKVEITNQIQQTLPPSTTGIEKVKKYLKKMKVFLPNVNGKKLTITAAMLKLTPIAERISFEQIQDPTTKNTNNRKRTTDISEILINEDDPNETIAVIGGSGSGKSVLASMTLQFYIDKEKFPFLLKVREINDDEILLEFVEFLQSYSSTKLSSQKDLEDLLDEHEEDIIIIVDGLDQSQKRPFPFGKVQPIRDGKTTAFSWLSRLFEKKEMANAKLIYTSREASMLNPGISCKPDQVFRLKGFTEEGMKLAMKGHDKNADVNQIYHFIQSKGGSFSTFATIPVILSIITLIYKEKKDELEASSTLSSLYGILLDEYQLFKEEPQNMLTLMKNTNQLFYDMLKESKYSFTELQIQNYQISLENLEKVSMITVDHPERRRTDPKNVRITPNHQSIQEYHAAQFIANEMDVQSFKQLVDNHLFSPDLQDQWNMVRRFVSGILSNENHEKKSYFMEAYIRTSEEMLSTQFHDHVAEDRRRDLEELQCSLNLDLMEMPNEIDSIKSSLSSVRYITIETRPKDVTMMEGTNFFLSQLDPHIFRLIIYLSSNCDLRSFNRMASSIGKLSKKIGWLSIRNINLPSSHVDQILQLIDKTDDLFHLRYTSATTDDEMRTILSQAQSFVDSKPTLGVHIQLNHKWRDYLIRQQPDVTSLTSSNHLFKQAKIYKSCKEIDLRLLTSSSILQSIIGLEEWKRNRFFFTICNKMEIRTFTELMNKVKIHVYRIILCLPEDVENDDLKLFFQTIAEHQEQEKQIYCIHITNIVWSDFYFDKICEILPNVERVQIDIIEEIDDDEKERIMIKFRPHVRKSCKLGIDFMDDRHFIQGD